MSSSHRPGVIHVYDDIEEEDNRLPNWWLFILWATVIFAFGYWFYYHSAGLGPGSMEAYKAEAAEAARLAAKSKPPPTGDETLLAMLNDPQQVQLGQQQFQTQCAACHGAKGQGVIGPNLTDAYWLHGAKPLEIQKVIAEGVVAKGMPSWEKPLGPDRVRAVAAYVLTLKGKNEPGKPPQGERVQ